MSLTDESFLCDRCCARKPKDEKSPVMRNTCRPCAAALFLRERRFGPEPKTKRPQRPAQGLPKRNYLNNYEDPPSKDGYGRWSKYGLSELSFRKLAEFQNHKCAICGTRGPLVIDHCHRTGNVRGLLCGNCNTGLGMFKDSSLRLHKAADYIARRGAVSAGARSRRDREGYTGLPWE